MMLQLQDCPETPRGAAVEIRGLAGPAASARGFVCLARSQAAELRDRLATWLRETEPASPPVTFHELPPDAFPLLLELLDAQSRAVRWSMAVAHPGAVRIPGCAETNEGKPVIARVTYPSGEVIEEHAGTECTCDEYGIGKPRFDSHCPVHARGMTQHGIPM